MASGAAVEFRFYRDVRPILSNHCFRCHGPDAEKRETELRLDTRQGLLGATATGKAIVVPGDPPASELYRRITAPHADEQMPPAEANVPLSQAQIEVLRRWIEAGAQWQEHWAYGPLVRPALPRPSGAGPADNPIDRFILARLEREGLAFSAVADAITLARRLSLDLTGLPPAPVEVEAFAGDASGSRYVEFVEKLLASAAYGERMAVYWLDLVRYADSGGYHSDVDQPISPYRDYVIAAFNDNLPFDQFTREQLAGDLLPRPTIAERIATGYNRLNKTTEEGGAQAGEYLAKSAADRVRTTSGVWLAATLGCAECHDHKYDPFTARDFYSFAAFFADVKEQGVYSAGGRAPELALPTPDQSARMAELKAAASEVERRLAGLSGAQADDRPALETRAKELAETLGELKKSLPRTMITVSVPPREMRVLPRGNWLDSSGARVEPALPAFLAAPSGQRRLTRLDLAEWLVARDNPLTARVFVNRLWKLFFGVGLSKSLDDFGAQGEPPTHPELLDWLAIEFVDSGWDIKHMVRLLVNSRAYRQASVPSAELIARDPANRLFARQGRWRLEAEFIRDAALVISKQLVRRIGGPSVKPYQPEGYWEFLNFPKRDWKADRGSDQYRRGLYTHWQRTFLHPSLLAFDAPSREECAADRPVSNTPQGALVLLNDPTYVECARVFAQRVLDEGGTDDASRIAWAWRGALSRAPEARESALLLELLSESRAKFEANEPAAQSLVAVGQAPISNRHRPGEIAAWTAVTRAILNLHETVSRN
jgi:hypothetical protein